MNLNYNEFDAIIAKSHSAEYLMHKYWARKPHNILAYFISKLSPYNGNILDPFCGSGVVLNEAKKLGRNSVGFDINPSAVLISKVLIDPPNVEEFSKIVGEEIDKFSSKFKYLYTLGDKTIRYVVHEIVVECPNCHAKISYSDAVSDGRKRLCSQCGHLLKYNLENLVDTRIKRIFCENNKVPIEEPEDLFSQKIFSDTLFTDINKYNFKFVTNRRILAFEGLETKKLFTPRNYSVISYMADEFNKIDNEKVRRAAMLLLTASVAQCSRLIPNRNNLSTGGPAWSVPGFWVPSEHLETNPIIHIKARFKKFLKALKEIGENTNQVLSEVIECDAIDGMQQYRANGNRADLVFFDPPYGDSVPYLEFSSIWNSFLGDFPDANKDISISDRMPKLDAWENYHCKLKNILNEIRKTLKEDGNLLITFNNNDIKAWEALIGALQYNNFMCQYVTYQIPAVISSKAQFSVEGSYISDIYSVYQYVPNLKKTTDLTVVANALKKAALSRRGTIAKNLVDRIIMIEWLKNNISVDLLCEKNSIINTLFEKKGNKFHYKNNSFYNGLDLRKSANESAKDILKNGPCDWNELYKKISVKYAEYGFLDPGELKMFLDGHIVIDKKRCIAYLD